MRNGIGIQHSLHFIGAPLQFPINRFKTLRGFHNPLAFFTHPKHIAFSRQCRRFNVLGPHFSRLIIECIKQRLFKQILFKQAFCNLLKRRFIWIDHQQSKRTKQIAHPFSCGLGQSLIGR